MQALEFWKIITVDKSNLLESLIGLLNAHGIRYCVIGGVAVNAYAEPIVTLDLDLVVAVDQIDQVQSLLAQSFTVKPFAHSLNISVPGSDLRVQVQTDPRYAEFVQGCQIRQVLGLSLPVASLENVLQGKIWAVQDPERRASKRQKDLADISRLLEEYPQMREHVPPEILAQLVQ